MNTANYSLLTLRPSLDRIDELCVGVAALSGDSWHFTLLPNSAKLQVVDSDFTQDRLNALALNLQTLLSDCITLDEARKTLKSHSASASMHDFEGVFGYQDDTAYAKQINEIMLESVLPPLRQIDKTKAVYVKVPQRIRTKLRNQFKNMGILGKTTDEINDHKVVASYPISIEHDLIADFALKNGAMHITETIDFDVQSESATIKKYEAHAKCLALRTAFDVFGKETKRYIVVGGSNNQNANRSVDLLSTVGDLFDLSSSVDMANYFKIMERSAAHIG